MFARIPRCGGHIAALQTKPPRRNISSGAALREAMDNIIDIVWERIERAEAKGRTITLKLKYTDFTPLTRAKSLTENVADKMEFARIGHALLEELLPLPMPIRLMGLTLSNLEGDGDDQDERKPDTAQLSLL